MNTYTYTYQIFGFDCSGTPIPTLFFYVVSSGVTHLQRNGDCVVAYHPCDACSTNPIPTPIAFHGVFSNPVFDVGDTKVDPVFFIPEYCGCPWCDIAYGDGQSCQYVVSTNPSHWTKCYICLRCYLPHNCNHYIFKDMGYDYLLNINIRTTVYDEYG